MSGPQLDRARSAMERARNEPEGLGTAAVVAGAEATLALVESLDTIGRLAQAYMVRSLMVAELQLAEVEGADGPMAGALAEMRAAIEEAAS